MLYFSAWTSKPFRRCICCAAIAALSVAALGPAQITSHQSKDKVLQEIRNYADEDVTSGIQLNERGAADFFEDEGKQAGLTRLDIGRTYRYEYIRNKEAAKHWWDEIPRWLYLVFVIIAFLWRPLKTVLEDRLKRAYESIYEKCFGTTLFRGQAIIRYRQFILQEYETFKVPFREAPLKMSEVFVPLVVSDVGVQAAIQSSIPREQTSSLASEVTSGRADYILARRAIKDHERLIIKGIPGAGKSMLLKSLLLAYATESLIDVAGHSSLVPVLLELSRLRSADLTLWSQLVAAFDRYGLPQPDSFLKRSLESTSLPFFSYWAKPKQLLLLLDGLDEVNASERSRVAKEIVDFVQKYRCRVIVTCRTQVYREELLPLNAKTFEIAEFGDDEIIQFLQPWKASMTSGHSVEQLMTTLRERPRILALARNPLVLSMIAYLYAEERWPLPRSRGEFYRRSTALLLEKWQGDYNQFGVPPKLTVLAKLALRFQCKPREDLDRLTLSYDEVLDLLKQVQPTTNIASEKIDEFLEEIINRSGLLLRIDGGRRYQFAHLTIQEFFAAIALSGDPTTLIANFKEDSDTWREVIKLWCAIAQDSTSVVEAVSQSESITAIDCITDANVIKAEVAEQVVQSTCARLIELVTNFEYERLPGFSNTYAANTEIGALARAFGGLASAPGRGSLILTWLRQSLNDDRHHLEAVAAEALRHSNLPEAAALLLQRDTQTSLSALCLMGDVAIEPVIESQTPELLMKIDTPRAIAAAVRFLWEPGLVAERAALAIGRRMKSSKFENELEKIPERDLGIMPESYRWVIEPYQAYWGQSLSRIAAQCAYLYDSMIKRDPKTIVDSRDLISLDPRISLGLFAGTGNKSYLTILSDEGVRNELEKRIQNTRNPRREDWIGMFRKENFELGNSVHFWICRIAVGVLFCPWLYAMMDGQKSATFGLSELLSICYVTYVALFLLGAFAFDSDLGFLIFETIALVKPTLRSMRGLFGPGKHPINFALAVAGISTGLLWTLFAVRWASDQLLRQFPRLSIIPFWISIWVFVALVVRDARKRESRTNNPLRGLLPVPQVKNEI